MGSYPMNRYAPSYFQGVPPPPPGSEASDDKSCDYVYSPPTGQLTANQFLNPDTLEIQVDADFRLRAFYLALFTGPFQMQLIDSNGYQLFSGMINSAAFSTLSYDPTVISPEHPFPAGGKIQIVIQDLSGNPNPLQIVFRGVKRFRVQVPAK